MPWKGVQQGGSSANKRHLNYNALLLLQLSSLCPINAIPEEFTPLVPECVVVAVD